MIRIAVVGAGIMGSNHARILQVLPGVQLTAVVDPDRTRGEALAKAFEMEYRPVVDDLDRMADAAVVATPSESHADVGIALLKLGLDVLIEKPLASTVEDADRLVQAAADFDRVVGVGHVERFNPAVLELDRVVVDPVHIELTRMGPFSPRITSDVILDLMIHDLDLALSIARSEVSSVQAIGRKVRTSSVDIATALLEFENGVTAAVTASRVGQTKVRLVQVTQRENYVVADLVRQDVTINRVDHSEFTSDAGTSYRQSGLVEIPFLENRGEPLALELRDFICAVRDRRAPHVTAEQARKALELVQRVRHIAAKGS